MYNIVMVQYLLDQTNVKLWSNITFEQREQIGNIYIRALINVITYGDERYTVFNVELEPLTSRMKKKQFSPPAFNPPPKQRRGGSWYRSTNLQQSFEGSISLHMSGHIHRADCQHSPSCRIRSDSQTNMVMSV